jgi:hypothetical protein
MPASFLASGLGSRTFDRVLRQGVRKAKPAVLGIAVAYTSVAGFNRLSGLLNAEKVEGVCLVTDTTDCVTHPNALAAAMKAGWEVRVVDSLPGTFHPKLYLGGVSFDSSRSVVSPTLAIVGSANLSRAALFRNGECSYLQVGSLIPASANTSWCECWDTGQPLTQKLLAAYGVEFARRNKRRAIEDMLALGVSDEEEKNAKGPQPASMPTSVATAAWAGLQSFTGDYNLQVEFPRDAGEVLKALLAKGSQGGSVQLLCSDGQTREFKFRYYAHNGMFRLNVPNATPLVDWVRANHDGIAVVEASDGTPTTFQIMQPGGTLSRVAARSYALGTWGATSTRQYGWY